jgi:hypothetical protein
MPDQYRWVAYKNKLSTMPWLIIVSTVITSVGWLADDSYTMLGLSTAYLKLLTLPLALALMTGMFPNLAPFDPERKDDFWQIASTAFRLFLPVFIMTLIAFKLNKN